MFMLSLAASERAEKNPLKIKFRKDIVESYKPIVWAEPRPVSMLQNVSHLSWYGRVGLTATFYKIAVNTKQHRIHIPNAVTTRTHCGPILIIFYPFSQFVSCSPYLPS